PWTAPATLTRFSNFYRPTMTQACYVRTFNEIEAERPIVLLAATATSWRHPRKGGGVDLGSAPVGVVAPLGASAAQSGIWTPQGPAGWSSFLNASPIRTISPSDVGVVVEGGLMTVGRFLPGAYPDSPELVVGLAVQEASPDAG